ncbi:MAG TPA: GTPase [Planctomycetota bacterium]|nr:GTPase [Planctomycetota bacterium]
MLGDTIVALASAAGPAARAVLRLSGPRAREAAATVFAPALPARRAQVDGFVRVRGGRLAAMALVMVAPASFTGEDVVELHVPGSVLLVQLLLEQLVADGRARGVRQALPGEFTARACQNGRLELAQAEGVLLLLHAADAQQAAAAVQWLRGGLSAVVLELRSRLQDALALLEAGLDFADGEIDGLDAAAWSGMLPPIAERLQHLLAALPTAAPGGEVLLLGRANAGKSSLANALAGRAEVLVADVPGTTRDLLRVEIAPGVAVWDAPGDLDDPGVADAAALALRERLAGRAAAMLAVLDATVPSLAPALLETALPCLAVVWTKADLTAVVPQVPAALAAHLGGAVPVLTTSAATGAGIAALRALLERSARGGIVDAGGPLRGALRQALAAVRAAHAAARHGAEVAAAELHTALTALDGIAGSHSPEQLLDRIYRRFCLGK